jgi:hypothetical protein
VGQVDADGCAVPNGCDKDKLMALSGNQALVRHPDGSLESSIVAWSSEQVRNVSGLTPFGFNLARNHTNKQVAIRGTIDAANWGKPVLPSRSLVDLELSNDDGRYTCRALLHRMELTIDAISGAEQRLRYNWVACLNEDRSGAFAEGTASTAITPTAVTFRSGDDGAVALDVPNLPTLAEGLRIRLVVEHEVSPISLFGVDQITWVARKARTVSGLLEISTGKPRLINNTVGTLTVTPFTGSTIVCKVKIASGRTSPNAQSGDPQVDSYSFVGHGDVSSDAVV